MNCKRTYPWVFAVKYSPDKRTYNIHGLWNDEAKKPNSDDEKFKQCMISKELLKLMEINWNSDIHKQVQLDKDEIADANRGELKSSDDNEKILLDGDYHFWAHEWNKHGRIAGMNPDDYFRTTLKLLEERKQRLPRIKLKDEYHFNLDEDLTELSNTL